MQLKHFLTSTLAALASAQTLNEALASQNASLSTLAGLIANQSALATTLSGLSNITILAPNNAAFARFLNTTAGASAATKADVVANLLTYHVINGTFPSTSIPESATFVPTLLTNSSYANVTGGQRVEVIRNGTNVSIFSGLKMNASVVTADLKFSGGVIHIIDHVLTIPTSPASTATDLGATSLVGALTNTSLAATVNGLRNVTIFAPANSAFSAISSALGNLSTTALSGILTYHVVPNVLGYSSALTNNMMLPTVNGQSLTVRIENGSVFVNSAKVLIADILVSNGVVHVIDNVLNPSNTAATPVPTATTQSVAFSGASSGTATEVPFTSGVATSTVVPAATSGTSTAGAPEQTAFGKVGMGALLGGAAVIYAGM